MKTATILKAITCLREARSHLMVPCLTIRQQIDLGGQCIDAYLALERELSQEAPEVSLTDKIMGDGESDRLRSEAAAEHREWYREFSDRSEGVAL